MMDALDNLNTVEIRNWLEQALRGARPLPRLTPDESPHVALLRLEKEMKRSASDSLRDACLQLVRSFCAEGHGESAYVKELLFLASSLKLSEAVPSLAQLARRFGQTRDLSLDIRQAVLATLVDTPPPQPTDFWTAILRQDPNGYASMALSGALATNPDQAVQMLADMPNSERVGHAVSLVLDITFDELPRERRFRFVDSTRRVLPLCGPLFRGPLQHWAESKGPSPVVTYEPSILAGLKKALGKALTPRTHSAKLCQSSSPAC